MQPSFYIHHIYLASLKQIAAYAVQPLPECIRSSLKHHTGLFTDFSSSDETSTGASAGATGATGAAGFGGVGAIQKAGYRRCKLFNSNAHTKSIVEDNRTTGK